jgi:hypothetical protein
LGKERKSLPGFSPALSMNKWKIQLLNEWKIELLVETRMPKSRTHQGFGFVGIKRSF